MPSKTNRGILLGALILAVLAEGACAAPDGLSGWGSVPAACATLVAAGLAGWFAYNMWMFNEVSLRRQVRQDHIRMLLDADRMIEERPALWAIFEGHDDASAKSHADDGEAAREAQLLPFRLKAFVYYHLNMYEAVHAFYEPLSQHANDFSRGLVLGELIREDGQYYEAWKQHIRYFLRSKEVTRIAQSAIHNRELSPDFVRFLIELSEDRLQPAQGGSSGKSINR